MTVNHWHVHQDTGNQACFVTEVHSNIAQEGKEACCQLANVLAVLAHELSEPLTAIGNYVDGAQRILQQGSPDQEKLRKAMGRRLTKLPAARKASASCATWPLPCATPSEGRPQAGLL